MLDMYQKVLMNTNIDKSTKVSHISVHYKATTAQANKLLNALKKSGSAHCNRR